MATAYPPSDARIKPITIRLTNGDGMITI